MAGFYLPLEVGPIKQDARDFRKIGDGVPHPGDSHRRSVGVCDAWSAKFGIQPASAKTAEQEVRLVVHGVDRETLRFAEAKGSPQALGFLVHIMRHVRWKPRQTFVQLRIRAKRGCGHALDRGSSHGCETPRVRVLNLRVPVAACLPVVEETQPLERYLPNSRVCQFVPKRFFVEDRVGGTNQHHWFKWRMGHLWAPLGNVGLELQELTSMKRDATRARGLPQAGCRWPIPRIFSGKRIGQPRGWPTPFILVAPAGFEPAISALRGRCPGPLDEGATCFPANRRIANWLAIQDSNLGSQIQSLVSYRWTNRQCRIDLV